METTTAIASASLLHDIGKVAERAGMKEQLDIDTIKQDYRYGHAHITEIALDQLNLAGLDEPVSPEAQPEETIRNLAARHHNARTPMEFFIQVADRLASGHERLKADDKVQEYETEGRERKSQQALLNLLGRVGGGTAPSDNPEDTYFPLQSLENIGDDPASFYPCQDDSNLHTSIRQSYPQHWQEFVEQMQKASLHATDHFETLYNLCESYLWCLPASTRKEEIPDVSLFQHVKATAAIASCLYQYHYATNQFSFDAIEDKQSSKYLLFCGDFSGIQNFIYAISSKGAYKNLKGRSFYVQLLCRLLAKDLMHQQGLTSANILYSSGGKFYALLPNRGQAAEQLQQWSETTNQMLFQEFGGHVYLRTAWMALSSRDLVQQTDNTLSSIWDNLTRSLIKRDRQRFASLAEHDYERLFGVDEQKLTTGCEVCHKPVAKDSSQPCRTCQRINELGSALRQAKYVFTAPDKHALDRKPILQAPTKEYVWLLPQLPATNPKQGTCYCLDASSGPEAREHMQRQGVNVCHMMVGGNHSFDQEFEEIAQKAKGIKRLGVLRMDVDNLGQIFGQGLANYRHDHKIYQDYKRFHTLGRIITLSSQLELFFSGLLPRLVHKKSQYEDQVTVVYAGGDDLFLLGAWNLLPSLAQDIRHNFQEFCGNNEVFDLSGGLEITGGKFPIYKSAQLAGNAEEKAKKHKTQLQGGLTYKKRAFAFLNQPMAWPLFHEVNQLREKLLDTLTPDELNKLNRRLQQIAVLWQEHNQGFGPIVKQNQIQKHLEREKWRWRMVYSLDRFCADNSPKTKSIVDELKNFILSKVAVTETTGIELLGTISRWLELETRKEGGK